jgi:D-alanyl-D-alanine carboxypeptidase
VQGQGNGQSFSLFSTAAAAPTGTMKPSEMLAMAPAAAEPVVVYTGPKRDGAALIAAIAADEASQTVRGKLKRGKGKQVAAVKPTAKPEKKPDAAAAVAARPAAKPEAKPTPPKTAAKPASSKPAADKPATAAAKPADKPKAAAPKAAKPDARTSAATPATGIRLAAKPKDASKSSQ